MSTKVPDNPNPFTDPNAALQMFNQYFGNLRNQYGEDVVRQVGFTPKEFQDLQAKLRNLQLDRSATPEQHREAYMQARDTLARRLTTPLEATRSYSEVPQPKPAPSPAPAVGNDGTMPPVVPMNVMSPDRKSPTKEQLYAYARAVGRGETGQWDPTLGTFVMTAQRPQPQPQQGGLTQAEKRVMPSIDTPPPPSPIPPQPPMPAFDPNAALQTFNKRAAELNASGKGLFASGMAPDEFRMHQGILRNLQLNPNATPEQHADILNKSMAFLNQYSGATPQPMVDPNVPYRPTGPDAFYGTQPATAQPMPAPAAPAFDPNAALQNLNAHLGRINQGGGQLDMNFVRDQQARLRDLQLDRSSTQEQHDAAYRAALGELRNRYPDAFAA